MVKRELVGNLQRMIKWFSTMKVGDMLALIMSFLVQLLAKLRLSAQITNILKGDKASIIEFY